jgi:uncharacterized 2Fe-2S/4Fe-4S cluster protein (DUF4445 family)
MSFDFGFTLSAFSIQLSGINMSPLPKHRISFSPGDKSIEVLPGTNLLEAASLAGHSLASSCGGNGACGQCRVKIVKGKTLPPNSQEKRLLTEAELKSGLRLACCISAEGDLEVSIPKRSLLRGEKLQVEGFVVDIAVDPVVKAFDVHLKAASLDDSRADLDRLIHELQGISKTNDLHGDISAIKQLSPLLRTHKWQVTCYARLGEIIGFAPIGAHPVGVAIDLGTTKIAAYLLDLVTGEELSSAGTLNPQIRFGDDVMSRLHYAVKNAGSTPSELATSVRESIRNIIRDLTEKAGVQPAQVAEICIVGNTAMTHLLLDLPVRQLAVSPYVASVNKAIDIKASELDMITTPGAYVHILPGIGGFVGPDHVAMILSSDIDRADVVTLGIDIGTNTEIVIRRPYMPNLVSLSCPSGPAFEGAHVTDGMRAAEGAIESVRLTEEGATYKTIGDAQAIGLCGSGIIDAVAELYRWNLIDERGRFNKKDGRVRQGARGSEFQLVAPSGDQGQNEITITQKDIDEILLAKGAIRAGIEALLEVTKTPPEMVEEVIIAGAFGSYINLLSAIEIGLFPYMPNARYRQVGNGSGAGARRALISGKERKRAQRIAANTKYLELTTHPNFNRQFAAGLRFPEKQAISP